MSAAFKFCGDVLGPSGLTLLWFAYKHRENQLSWAYVVWTTTWVLLLNAAMQTVFYLLGWSA